jgi:hypothetical protein
MSLISNSDEIEGLPHDTSITIKQDRPLINMDSIDVAKFDYEETGLLVK